MHPFFDCAVNRVYEREVAATVRDGMAMATRDGARGFAILNRNLVVVQANPMARRLVAAWTRDAAATDTDNGGAAWRLPPVLAAECRELYSQWRTLVRADPNATDFRPLRRVSHARVPRLEASITLVCPSTAGVGEPTFVIEIERRAHGVVLDTPVAAASVLRNMTATERAVATVLADGLSNQEIADRLGKSVATVKFLLHRIYQKTGVPSRAALVALVLRSLQDL
jgi:DNA-binding CsgD family transcriptional regulator